MKVSTSTPSQHISTDVVKTQGLPKLAPGRDFSGASEDLAVMSDTVNSLYSPRIRRLGELKLQYESGNYLQPSMDIARGLISSAFSGTL